MNIIDVKKIENLLDLNLKEGELDVILEKAKQKKGLELAEVAKLLTIGEKTEMEKLFTVANQVKKEIYGDRIVLFAPLYCSNFCVNDCAYCSFHVSNDGPRKKLSLDEVGEQTEILMNMGHKRLLLEFGEDQKEAPIDYVVSVIEKIYSTKVGNGEIRRVNVNIAATIVDDYKKLKEAGIGTYQLFQETYHEPTYRKLHRGPKADYNRQLTAMDRAFEAGIDDLGIGVLFGLFDYRFEVLALLQHAEYMDKVLGVGPHTISVPRFRPAYTVDLDSDNLVSDENFLKIIAILRLAVPYTGIIISTRETPEMRQQAFALGVSQASAASCAEVNGYKHETKNESAQFDINDHRSLDAVVQDICRLGFLPSFCTACYRVGRTGDVFMEFAKSGKINNICSPNALMTFKEYLIDYASEETKKVGDKLIFEQIKKIPDEKSRQRLVENLKKLEEGKRDIYV